MHFNLIARQLGERVNIIMIILQVTLDITAPLSSQKFLISVTGKNLCRANFLVCRNILQNSHYVNRTSYRKHLSSNNTEKHFEETSAKSFCGTF